MNPQAIRQLQTNLGLPATGILDSGTIAAMNNAVSKSLSTNKDVIQYGGNNTSDAILNAYTTGDWSNVLSLTGKPFTPDQQKAAVSQAEAALAPAYKAQQEYDTATTEDTLRNTQEGLADTTASDARQFGLDKNALDKSSADNGVLFSGSRVQKLNDLRSSYETRDAIARRDAAESAAATARTYGYNYGSGATRGLSSLYSLPGPTSYNPNVAGGKVTPSRTISAVYDPSANNFQGVKPAAQMANVQTRAASLLANKANKLTLSGIGTKL